MEESRLVGERFGGQSGQDLLGYMGGIISSSMIYVAGWKFHI